jgi:DNA-binding protein H-NS
MTNTYKELLLQREALEEAISKARAQEISEAKTKVRELVAEFGLTIQDVFPSGRSSVKTGSKSASVNKVAPKYRDPSTGQTWTGRGKAPKWIQGQERSKFLIV